MHRFYILITLCLTSLLLAGCGDLMQQIDIAMYGSEEKARIANEEAEIGAEVRRNERDLKRQGELERELNALIIETRKAHKVRKVRMDEKLNDYARIRVKEVAIRNSKYRPNGEMYHTLYNEFLGGRGFNMKEARSARSKAEDVIKEWLSDSEARKILLAPYASSYGVGVSKHNSATHWVLVIIN